MTCLEHLIENTLCSFEKGINSDNIRKQIQNDLNLEYAGITVDQCYEICQYIWFTYVYYRDFKIQEQTAQKVYDCFGFDIDNVLRDFGADTGK